MRKCMVVIVLIFVLGISTTVFAESSANQASKSNKNITSVQTSNEKLTEAQAYKLLYDNEKELNGKILSTVYWALSGIGAVIIALIGGNIFYNYRVNKKEIENIYQDLNIQFNEFENKSYDKVQEQIKESLQLSKSSLESELKNLIGDQSEEIKMLHKDVYKLEAEIWTSKAVYQNALSSYIQAGNVEIELGYNLEKSLQDILDSLQKSSALNNFYSTELFDFMEKVPDRYSILKNKINSVAKNLPIV